MSHDGAKLERARRQLRNAAKVLDQRLVPTVAVTEKPEESFEYKSWFGLHTKTRLAPAEEIEGWRLSAGTATYLLTTAALLRSVDESPSGLRLTGSGFDNEDDPLPQETLVIAEDWYRTGERGDLFITIEDDSSGTVEHLDLDQDPDDRVQSAEPFSDWLHEQVRELLGD